MGFYDVNCAITSICLGPGAAVLVPLRKLGPEQYRPIGLPMKGEYDRLGAIDLDEPPTLNMALFAEYFSGLDEQRLQLRADSDPMDPTISGVVASLERNTTVWLGDLRAQGWESMMSLDGDPLVFALISPQVWDAIAAAAPPAGAAGELLAELAVREPVLREIYGAHVDQVADEVRELVAVDRFLTARGLPWKTHVDGEVDFGAQQSLEDLEWWLRWALEHHGGDPVLRVGLDAHAADVERWRREYEEEQQEQAQAEGPSMEEMLAELTAMKIEAATVVEGSTMNPKADGPT